MNPRPPIPKSGGLAGLWFPVALILLMLLTIPAAILLVLKLMGREARVNEWLFEHLHINYQIALPGWAAVVMLMVPFLLLLLYFLKMRRHAVQVPSTFLWKKSVEDFHVNSLFQWLRKNLLLLLQLACVLLLLFGVMAFKVFGGGGTHYILIVDSSASMAVADVEPNRLEAAKRMALAEIDRHADNDVGMVIEFNGGNATLQPYTSDRNLLRRAVQGIRPTRQPTRIEGALRRAESLANPPNSAEDAKVRPADDDPAKARAFVPPEGIRAEVHVYSDGCFSQSEKEALGQFAAGNLDISYHQVGSPGPAGTDNVGLVSLLPSVDRTNAARIRVSARVMNFRGDPVTVKVRLQSRVLGEAGFKLADVVLDIPGRRGPEGEPQDGLADFVLAAPPAGQVLELHALLLDPRDDSPWRDLFPLDDEAWLLVGDMNKARVLVVTPGNKPLRWYFAQPAVERIAEMSTLDPTAADYAEKYARLANDPVPDLVIFDRCSPPTRKEGAAPVLPQANTFFIDQLPPPFGPLSDAEKRQRLVRGKVRILNPSHRHPLMRSLTGLDQLVFTQVWRFDLDPAKDDRIPPDVPRLLETENDGAVLFTLARGSFTDVVLTCPLVADDAKNLWAASWMENRGFPLFMSNMLFTLGHVRENPADELLQPGQLKIIRPRTKVDRVEVIAPGADKPEEANGNPEAGEFSYIAEQVGVHRARWAGSEQAFAVNLLDADESDIRPRETIAVGQQRLSSVTNPPATVDTWKWGVLIAVGLLFVEWALYQRRFFH